jgi:DNA-binding transcriptional ArsR family regulator
MPKAEAPRSTRKVKHIGTETYINSQTGESQEFQVIDIEERDADFSKLWMAHILDAVQELGNAKMRVMMHLIAVRDRMNNVIATAQEIADAVGVSEKTVRETIKTLVENKIITRRRGIKGVLMLNPDVVFKGTRGARLNVLYRYREWEQASLPGFEEAAADDQHREAA